MGVAKFQGGSCGGGRLLCLSIRRPWAGSCVGLSIPTGGMGQDTANNACRLHILHFAVFQLPQQESVEDLGLYWIWTEPSASSGAVIIS